MPMTREMRGFSSKQFLGQYTLKNKEESVVDVGVSTDGRLEREAWHLGQCLAGLW